jgi:hypothetical protein
VLSRKIFAVHKARTAASSFLLTRRWQAFDKDVLEMVSATESYVETLQKNVARSQLAHSRMKSNLPEKTSDLKTVEASTHLEDAYVILSSLLAKSQPYKPHLVTAADIDQWTHANRQKLSDDSTRRKRQQRWRESMQLAVPCRHFKFHAGGPHTTIIIIWKIPSDAEDRDVTLDLRSSQEAHEQLPNYMSRAQWGEIKAKYSSALGGGIPAGLLQHIAKDISGDSSMSRDKEQTNRVILYCVSQGVDALWPDLRAALCGGQNQFDVFFKFAENVVEDITGATAYRHGKCGVLQADQTDRLSTRNPNLVSIASLHNLIVSKMRTSPDPVEREAPVPSQQLLRISLTPQNETNKIASCFTARLSLTRAICRAVMRKSNVDSHYNHKMNQYCNLFIHELNGKIYDDLPRLSRPTIDNELILSKGVTKFSLDDKGSISIGEPDHPVRTNVRAKSASLVTKEDSNKANALDHDWHRANVVCSFTLASITPTDVDGSFRHGHIIVAIKDKATQVSSSMRHAVEFSAKVRLLVARDDELRKQHASSDDVPEGTSMPYGMVLRADGGSDRNPKNLSVQLSMLFLFMDLDVDFLILEITAADVSHVNEVEGVMPTANVVLQHQAFARGRMSPHFENKFKSANSGKGIRKVIETSEDGAQCLEAWRESMEPVRRNIESCLRNIMFTNTGISIVQPATDKELDDAWMMLKDKVDQNLRKDDALWTSARTKCPNFMQIHATHFKQDRYKLEISKCRLVDCRVCQTVSSKHKCPLPQYM